MSACMDGSLLTRCLVCIFTYNGISKSCGPVGPCQTFLFQTVTVPYSEAMHKGLTVYIPEPLAPGSTVLAFVCIPSHPPHAERHRHGPRRHTQHWMSPFPFTELKVFGRAKSCLHLVTSRDEKNPSEPCTHSSRVSFSLPSTALKSHCESQLGPEPSS